jgi:hypothetical protein
MTARLLREKPLTAPFAGEFKTSGPQTCGLSVLVDWELLELVTR